MGDQYYAEVKIFPNTFAPYQWAYCDGQYMAIAQNPTLYSLLGTSFGGDGRSNYALPDLKGRTVVCQGKSPRTKTREFGEQFGESKVQLTEKNLPSHNHNIYALKETAKENIPDNQAYLSKAKDSTLGTFISAYKTYTNGDNTVVMDENTLASFGGTSKHFNFQPFLTLRYCIAFDGLYPSRD